MTLEELRKELGYYNRSLQVVIGGNSYIREDEYGLSGKFGSDRGDYYDLYFGMTKINEEYNFTVKNFEDMIIKAYEQSIMIGYKGGEFPIYDDTRVTVGWYGCSGYYIRKVVHYKDKVIIEIEN